MKQSETRAGGKEIFGVDFHDFIEKQETASMWELASEFGLPLKDVRRLKRRLGRS